MIVTPVTRCLKVARPDAQAITTGGGLLAPVSPGGDSEAFGHHGSTKIVAGNQASGQQAIVLIHVFGTAIGGTGGEQLHHAVARRQAAWPGLTVSIGAVLGQLGRVNTQEPDAVLAEAEAVAVAGTAEPRNRRWRLIEGSGQQCRSSKQPDGQERPARAAKERFVMAEPTQDFTTR